MTFRPGRVLPLITRAIVGVAIVAVLLGRSSPSPSHGARHGLRRAENPRHLVVDCHLFRDHPSSPRILDTGTGAVTILAIPDGDRLTAIACSPWCDHDGRFHLIGCWRRVQDSTSGTMAQEFGLARCTFPGGRLLDRMTSDLLPKGTPCWFPDRSDRILFAAGNGRLYHCALPGDAQDGHQEIHPRPIAWEVPTPGAASVHLEDPSWPGGPIIGGRLLVELTTLPNSSANFPGPHLWWLQMGPDGESVVAAGRLIAPDAAASPVEERSPALGTSADGRPLLAYLDRRPGRYTWDLWLAPITTDAASGAPRVLASTRRKLAEECLSVSPAFSLDVRWVYAWRPGDRDGPRVGRFAVDAAADAPPARCDPESAVVATPRRVRR